MTLSLYLSIYFYFSENLQVICSTSSYRCSTSTKNTFATTTSRCRSWPSANRIRSSPASFHGSKSTQPVKVDHSKPSSLIPCIRSRVTLSRCTKFWPTRRTSTSNAAVWRTPASNSSISLVKCTTKWFLFLKMIFFFSKFVIRVTFWRMPSGQRDGEHSQMFGHRADDCRGLWHLDGRHSSLCPSRQFAAHRQRESPLSKGPSQFVQPKGKCWDGSGRRTRRSPPMFPLFQHAHYRHKVISFSLASFSLDIRLLDVLSHTATSFSKCLFYVFRILYLLLYYSGRRTASYTFCRKSERFPL